MNQVIHFDIQKLQSELKELEVETLKEGFWTTENKDEILKKIKIKKRI